MHYNILKIKMTGKVTLSPEAGDVADPVGKTIKSVTLPTSFEERGPIQPNILTDKADCYIIYPPRYAASNPDSITKTICSLFNIKSVLQVLHRDVNSYLPPVVIIGTRETTNFNTEGVPTYGGGVVYCANETDAVITAAYYGDLYANPEMRKKMPEMSLVSQTPAVIADSRIRARIISNLDGYQAPLPTGTLNRWVYKTHEASNNIASTVCMALKDRADARPTQEIIAETLRIHGYKLDNTIDAGLKDILNQATAISAPIATY